MLLKPLARALVAALALLAAPSLLPAAEVANVVTVKAFGGTAGDGINARGDLIVGTDGNLYGTSSAGGSTSRGAVFQVTPAGTYTTLHSFAGATTEGSNPYAAVVQASDGNLYGTTYLGGANSRGSVYKLTTAGTFTHLFSFTNASSGGFHPYTGLVQAADGNLYGTTLRGGSSDAGTIFRITTDGTLTAVHSFSGGADGMAPQGRLVVGADGALYGTTLLGGPADRGTVYRSTLDGTVTTLYSFAALGAVSNAGVATNADGANPRAGLLIGSDGNFYGTAYQGGASGYGSIFRMTPGGDITTLHAFGGPPGDGASPLAAVSQAADGSLAGTTERGGARGVGVAWQITPAGEYRLLHQFTNLATDGGTLHGSLVEFGGALHGASYSGGPSGGGVLFRLEQGSAGVLPVILTATPETLQLGAGATLNWSSPAASSCTASGAWTDTIATAGSKAETPSSAGVYVYVISCTDAASVVRSAYASLVVTAPAAQPVDGGGDSGGGALGAAELTALLLMVFAGLARRLRRPTGAK